MGEAWPALAALAAVVGLVWAAFRAGRKDVRLDDAEARATRAEAATDRLVDEHRVALDDVPAAGLAARLRRHAARWRAERRGGSAGAVRGGPPLR